MVYVSTHHYVSSRTCTTVQCTMLLWQHESFMNSCILQASVSVKRVGNFLKTSELDPGTVQWHPEAATGTYVLTYCCVL